MDQDEITKILEEKLLKDIDRLYDSKVIEQVEYIQREHNRIPIEEIMKCFTI